MIDNEIDDCTHFRHVEETNQPLVSVNLCQALLVIFVLYVYCEATNVLCRILFNRNMDCLLYFTEILMQDCLCKNWQLRVCDSEQMFVAK